MGDCEFFKFLSSVQEVLIKKEVLLCCKRKATKYKHFFVCEIFLQTHSNSLYTILLSYLRTGEKNSTATDKTLEHNIHDEGI